MGLECLNILAQTGVNEILNNGAITAQSIAQSWDAQWQELLLQTNTDNSLYGALNRLGIFFAVGTLLFFMLQWLRDVLYSEYSRPISALIWPFIVVLLLANPGNGTVLSNLTLSVRNYLNNEINQPVVTAGNGYQTYQEALNMSVAEEVVGSFLRPCQALTGTQQNQCLIKAKEKINFLRDEYISLYGERNWIRRLDTRVENIITNNSLVSQNNDPNDPGPQLEFNSFLGSTVQTSIKNFFISLQFAFQNLIESTMLLVATLGPLAVGGSLLPVAGKPIFAWLTGFLSVGIAKISFNIIAISTAAVIVNVSEEINPDADPDLMWFIIFMGVLAPILSLALSAAGGFAVFNAISNTAAWVRERV